MSARVLIVDDMPANVKLLEARLTSEYFDVLTASSGREALKICETEPVDIILLDVMMPGMDGFEVCKHLKSDNKTQQIPVVMVTALDQPSDRVRGLETGADDFLTKPVDDIALISRVKNLTRLKRLTDEMMLRAETTERLGIEDGFDTKWKQTGESGHIYLIEMIESVAKRMATTLREDHKVDVCENVDKIINDLFRADYDLIVLSLDIEEADGLRLVAQIRTERKLRQIPIMVIVEQSDESRLLSALDMGINDYVLRPIDNNELLARTKTQIKKKRYADLLVNKIEERVEMAITDQLTGLHNRRYMENHLSALVKRSVERGEPLSLMILDIDFFKNVNDTYGHDVGDLVLREFSSRLRRNTRNLDLACRIGGEEFVIILIGVDVTGGYRVAERLRQDIENRPFSLGSDNGYLKVTSSVGLSTVERIDDTPEKLLKRADTALYNAKRSGRNKVMTEAA